MRLNHNELRSLAHAFVAAHSGDSDENKHTQTFWNDFFFDIFGVKRSRVAVYEQSAKKIKGANGRIDLFWPGELLVEQKSRGKNLDSAYQQALGYIHGLSDAELPKRVVVCDFARFRFVDLEAKTEPVEFALADLPKHIELFNFILRGQTRIYKDQDPVNIRASELVGKLHDLLFASKYRGHQLEVFLTRIVFCLFADDTGIFEPRDILMDFLETRTAPDGHDLGAKLGELFTALNTPEAERQTSLDSDIARFPYVNGHLFEEYFPPPAFDADMRAALLNACRFDWTPISPAIFGSLFQSVMDAGERRRAGAHYTTEKNILKLIGPLFLDDLRAEYETIKRRRAGRDAALRKFHDKLAGLTFFDPACGAGNFLIIAYREIRRLELELLLELRDDRQREADAAALSRVDVDQFFGIEISEFPARIAETALWMMDHLMNLELSAAFGNYYPRIPLKKAPTIVHADALETDWARILPPEKCSYILGNPPFIGHHLQTPKQKELMKRTYGAHVGSAGVMDFVTAWFLKAAKYIEDTEIQCAFVATNSITQGEQVGILWRALAPYRLHINFAHRTFKWESEARGKAAVYCVMIGFSRINRLDKRLFEYAHVDGDAVEVNLSRINAYLVDAPWILLENESQNIFGLPNMQYGSKPTDDGNFLLTDDEKEVLLSQEPQSSQFIKPFVSAKEYLHGENRWVLWLVDASPAVLSKLPKVRARVEAVAKFRKASTAISTRNYAYPTLFRQVTQPKTDYILVPIHTSERRDYVPFSLFSKDTIVGNSCLALPDATLAHFGLIQSSMHMAWMKTVCGRLESRYRYSKDIVYNNFPLPPTKDLSKLEPLAQAVLDARALHPDSTLANLYDPNTMPPNLRAAHTALDRAVDKLYRPAGFASDRERVEHLFALYEAMQAPLLARPKGRRARKSPQT